MSIAVIGYIVIPLSLALLGALVAAFRISIGLGKYMMRSEEAQTRTADSNQKIADQLEKYMERTDKRLNEHDEQLAVLNYVLKEKENHARPRPQS
jgi:hypothetical protein